MVDFEFVMVFCLAVTVTVIGVRLWIPPEWSSCMVDCSWVSGGFLDIPDVHIRACVHSIGLRWENFKSKLLRVSREHMSKAAILLFLRKGTSYGTMIDNGMLVC